MKKKEYIKPDMEITWFDTEDVIRTSPEEGEGQEPEYSEDL